MQYLKYPFKTMNISQNYKDSFSHKPCYNGSPKGYPIDDCGSDKGRDYFYSPCDCKIKRIYGVGNNGTNTLWLESISKVKLANGTESFVTIMLIHPNDDDLKNLKVGQTFKQGTKVVREGTDGNATGNHIEIQVSNKKFSGTGWKENSKGGWVINNAIKPEDAFLVDTSFTKVKNKAGLNFKNIKVQVVNYYSQYDGKSSSLVDALKSIGVNSSFTNRSKIAKVNGIKLYLGTSKQNIQLLNLLKQGKLKKN